MMKKIFSAAIVAMSLAVLPVSAQTTTSASGTKAEKSCTATCKDKDGKKCDFESRVYEGMNLTEAQKQQLADLKANTKSDKKAKESIKAKEGKKDKKLTKEEKQARKQEREKARRAYLQEVRKIVGDDNYVIFLENQFVIKSDMKKAHKISFKGNSDKRSHNGDKGSKGPKGQRGNKGSKGPKAQK